jgi:iron complex outermembrane receptor protein
MTEHLPAATRAARIPSSRPCAGARLVAAALAGLCAAGAARATEVDVPAGPLTTALNRFAQQTGVALVVDAAQVGAATTPGLHGDYGVEDGFAALLRGTGWRVVRSDAGYVLVAAPASTAPGQTQVLPSQLVRVTGRASPAPAEADDSYKPTPDASSLRTTAETVDQAQIVNVVPAQVLRDQRPRNMDDALNNVSGITQGNTLAGTQDTIMKRGFGGNRDGSIMHNGMPLVQGRGFNAAAESVEVLKGPASLLYGIMDPGGVVNVVSKKPRLDARTTLSVVGSGYAGGRDGAGATLDTTGPIGDAGLAYRLVVDHVSEDYWRNFGTHRETLVAPSIAWYGHDTQAVFWYEYRQFLTPFDRGTALDPDTKRALAIPATERLDEPFNKMQGESNLAQTSIDHRLGNGWAAHANLSYDRETYDANQLRVKGVDTSTGTLSRNNDATHGALSTDSYATGYVDGHLDLASMRHDVQAGADLEYRLIYRKDLLRQATTTTFSYLDPVYGTESASSTVSATDSDQTDKLRNHALFAQDSIHLGERWIAIAGVRYQEWEQLAGRGRPFVVNTNTRGSAWLPRAGLVYKVDPDISVYASYTQSLKPTSTIAPLATGVVIDSGQAPESSKSWELGAKVDLIAGVTGTLALFDIEKKNVLVSQYNDTTQQTDWRTSGAARSRGVELDVSGQIDRHWSAIASVALVDAKTTEDPDYAGNRLWNVARQTASLSTVYDFGRMDDFGRLRIGGGAHHVDKRAGDSANSFWLPAYTTVDTFATYDTRISGKKVKFQLNVKNLFDRVYYTSSVNTYFISMGDARQFLLTSTLEF